MHFTAKPRGLLENSLFGSEDKNGKFSHLLLALMLTEKLAGSFVVQQNISGASGAKRHCSILLNN